MFQVSMLLRSKFYQQIGLHLATPLFSLWTRQTHDLYVYTKLEQPFYCLLLRYNPLATGRRHAPNKFWPPLRNKELPQISVCGSALQAKGSVAEMMDGDMFVNSLHQFSETWNLSNTLSFNWVVLAVYRNTAWVPMKRVLSGTVKSQDSPAISTTETQHEFECWVGQWSPKIFLLYLLQKHSMSLSAEWDIEVPRFSCYIYYRNTA